MMKLACRIFPATTFALVALLASCSKSPAPEPPRAKPRFHLAELTKEEVISLFNVPLADARIQKFEWDFDHPRYVRFIVEQSDDNEKTWQRVANDTLGAPVLTATLICQIEKELPKKEAPDSVRMSLRVRSGGRGPGAFSTWGDTRRNLEFRDSTFETRVALESPAEAFLVKNGSRAYRVRLEAADKAFGAY